MDYFTKKPVRAAPAPGPAACRQGRRARAAGGPHAPGGNGRTGRRKIFTGPRKENTGLRLAATGLRPVFTGIGPVRTGLSPVFPETGAVPVPTVGAVRTGGGGGGRPAPGGSGPRESRTARRERPSGTGNGDRRPMKNRGAPFRETAHRGRGNATTGNGNTRPAAGTGVSGLRAPGPRRRAVPPGARPRRAPRGSC